MTQPMPAPATGDPVRISRQAWFVLIATSSSNFLVGLDMSIANIAFPAIQSDFPGTSAADLSWLLTFFNVTFAGLLIIAGRLADRIGRRRVFNIGLILFVSSAAGLALAPTVPILVGMRGLQGLGAALMVPASLGLVVAAWPTERRTFAVAAWGSVLAVSTSIGPMLGGLIIELASWRWAFLVNVPIGVLAFWWAQRVLPETRRDPAAGRPDIVGSVLIVLATTSLLLAIVQGREWGWTSTALIGLLAFFAAALAVLLRHTMRHADPIVPVALFAIPTFRIATIAVFVFSLGFLSAFLVLVLFLTRVWGYTALEAGTAITALPVAATISSNASGMLAERIGFRATIVPGCLLFSAGTFWLWNFLGSEPDFLIALLPGTLMMGIGIGAAPAILSGAGVAAVPPAFFSVAGAVGQLARQLGSAIGIAIVVVIIGQPTDLAASLTAFDRAFIYLGTVTALAGLIALRLRAGR